MRYQLRIGSSWPPLPSAPGSGFQRFKTALLAFVALSVAIGVMIAAFVVGSLVAVIILIALLLTIIGGLTSKWWRRSFAHRQKAVSPRESSTR